MKDSISLFITFFLISSLMLQGCGVYFKVTSPKQEEKLTVFTTSHHKYAYTLKKRSELPFTKERLSVDIQRSATAKKALLDSFSSHGISEIIESGDLRNDRINIVVYEGLEPEDDAGTILLRFIYIPWTLISIVTFFLVPHYSADDCPVEIHIINPALDRDKQLNIIQTKYSFDRWIWLPFFFRWSDNVPEDVYYVSVRTMGGDSKPLDKIDYIGWRRIFDRVIAEAERY